MGWRYLTQAEVIAHAPCKLKGLLVDPAAADACIIVYNGESAKDPVVLTIFLATKNAKIFPFPGGLELDRGLYVGTFINITSVLVMWEPLPWQKRKGEAKEVEE